MPVTLDSKSLVAIVASALAVGGGTGTFAAGVNTEKVREIHANEAAKERELNDVKLRRIEDKVDDVQGDVQEIKRMLQTKPQ